MIRPESEDVSIVLIGSFNPGIFHPEWFRRQEILSATDADKAVIKVITPDIAEIIFLDMQLDVFPNRFALRTSDVSMAEKLQDVVVNVLKRLPHSPVTSCGINDEIHFNLDNESYWHKIGHVLAPKELIWDKFLHKPGMQSLTIKGMREGKFPGAINVTVQPSVRFKYGLWVAANSHYEVPVDDKKVPDSGKAVDFVMEVWKSALEMSSKTASIIFENIDKLQHDS